MPARSSKMKGAWRDDAYTTHTATASRTEAIQGGRPLPDTGFCWSSSPPDDLRCCCDRFAIPLNCLRPLRIAVQKKAIVYYHLSRKDFPEESKRFSGRLQRLAARPFTK